MTSVAPLRRLSVWTTSGQFPCSIVPAGPAFALDQPRRAMLSRRSSRAVKSSSPLSSEKTSPFDESSDSPRNT
jgi:hypothetical protein